MAIQVYLLLSGLAVLQCFAQKSGPESEFYTAAVVEYAPFEMQPDSEVDPALLMRKNALNHMYYMEQAARQGADIVVFPECGITGINLPKSREELRPFLTEIPDPKYQFNPCMDATGNTSQLLKDLSCASRIHGIYSAMNLPEIAPCAPQDGVSTACPNDGAFIYNTNIVFDRYGSIIARHRKYNLFLEPGFDIEPTAGHSTFDTDFGVRFGMFICFDILFRQPAVAMVTEHNITDVIFSTAWFSELPFLTAVQIQAAWSYATDTNFLASGYNDPATKNTGSGIFAGKGGVVTSVMAFDKLNQMLVAKVKKKSKISERADTNTAHSARTKRSGSGVDHDGSFVKIPTESEGRMVNEEESSYLFSKLVSEQTRHQENCVKQKLVTNDEIQNSREYDNTKVGNEIRIIVKRNVAISDREEMPTASVPSVKTHRNFESEMHLFNTALLNLTNVDDEGNVNGSLFLCHLSLCCNFTFTTTKVREIQTNMDDQQFFRVGIFDGSELGDYQTCLIMRCIGPDLESCREDFDHPKSQTPSTIFTNITIDGNFIKDGKINSGYDNSICYSNDDVGLNKQRIFISNNQEIQNLSIFSLYVDNFRNESNVNLLPYGNLNLYQDDLSHYNTSLIGSQNVNKQLNLCQGSLCCQFYIGAETEINSTGEEVPVKNSQLTSSNGYYFRIGVFEGVRKFGNNGQAGLQVCAIFACTTDNITTCGLLKNEKISHIKNEVDLQVTTQTTRDALAVVVIEESDDNNHEISLLIDDLVLKRVEIKGYFDKDNFIMPNTLTTKLLPFKGMDFEFSSESEQRSHVDKNSTFVIMKANANTVDDMLTFGIYARDFRKDIG